MNLTLSITWKGVLGAVAVAAAVIYRAQVVVALAPFVLAIAFSAVLEPAVGELQRKLRLPRRLAAFLSMVFFLAALTAVLLGLAGIAASELRTVLESAPATREAVIRWANAQIEEIQQWLRTLPPDVLDAARQQVQGLAETAERVTVATIQAALNMLTLLPAAMALVLVSLIATYFITADRERLVEGWKAVAPESWRRRIEPLGSGAWADLKRYLRAQLLLMLITGTGSVLGLLAVGAPYWLFAGVLVGLLDPLPVLGPGLVYIPWAAVTAVTGNPALAVKLLLVFAAVSAVRQVSEAKLVGDSLGVHPLASLLALSVGGAVWGVGGVLAAPLLVVAAKAIWGAWHGQRHAHGEQDAAGLRAPAGRSSAAATGSAEGRALGTQGAQHGTQGAHGAQAAQRPRAGAARAAGKGAGAQAAQTPAPPAKRGP